MTGYKVAKRVNAALKLAGLKEIPPQMVYQYIAKGYIESYDENGQNLVEMAAADAWIAKYVAKRHEKANA
jgi:hypothetical protein